ncbi:MAG TPA: Nramp family divalent metal transporter [Chthoniobacterales bacterium]|jgi:manganese transport protein
MKRGNKSGDTKVAAHAARVLGEVDRKWRFKQFLPFMGPAFIASIAYIDPGNFATNIQGGAEFGYTLLWVILASNLMAMLLQTLSAKLGIATGINLAEHCRNQFPPVIVWLMWGVMEVVSMATDLAEFLGAALGLYLLFGIPLWIAAIVTAFITLLILGLETFGFRPLEAVITAMVGVIAVCYLIETWLVRPDWGQVLWHSVVPQFAGKESVFLATGILGATVMPHVIFLHSSLTQARIVTLDEERRRRLYRFEILDVAIAMGVAGAINAAMLIMAAAAFYRAGLTHVGSIEEAYRTLEPLLGSAARTVFAVSLLASGLASASVGTMAGQVIMQGFLHRQIPIWVRRLVTMLPSLVVIGLGLDPTRTLVASQVVLSFGLPLAIVPLILFTRRRDLMGELVNSKFTTFLAVVVTVLIVSLNGYLLYEILTGKGS